MSRYPGISEPEQTIESMHNTILELKQLVETLSQQKGDRADHAVTFQDLLDRGMITPAQLNTADNQADNAIADLTSEVTDDITALDARIDAIEALGLSVPIPVNKGGTGQTTVDEALGEMIQAMTHQNSIDRINDIIPSYDATGDSGESLYPYEVAGMCVLATGSVSNAASMPVDLSATGYSNFKVFKLFVYHLRPLTDAQDIGLQFSDDGGGTFEADAADYAYGRSGVDDDFDDSGGSTGANPYITLITSAGNAADEWSDLEITICDPANTTTTKVFWNGSTVRSDNSVGVTTGGGRMTVAGASTDVRLIAATGNITGSWTLVGIM